MILKNADPTDELVDAMRIAIDAAASPRQQRAIQNRIDATLIGARGERDVAHHLAHAYAADPRHVVIHDLGLELDDLGAQIDHLVIRDDGVIACLETKSWSAEMTQHADGSWTARYGRQTRQVASPTEQARRHALLVGRLSPDHVVKPIVVVPADCSIERRIDDGIPVVRVDLLPSVLARIPSSSKIDPMDLAHRLVALHKPRLAAVRTHLDRIGYVSARPQPNEADLDRARSIHAKLMGDGHRPTIESAAIRALARGDVQAMIALGAGPRPNRTPQAVGQIRTRHGPSQVAVLDDGSMVFAVTADPRMKAHVRICAGRACQWDAKRHGWAVVPQETIGTIASLVADNRECFGD